MRPGTPGFVGARLREGREARELSATTLADLIGVTRAAVSQYENGVQSPHPEVMRRIADKLNLPMRFFLRSPFPEPPQRVYFRSMSAATKIERTRATRRYQWLKELVAYLRRFVEFPNANVPMFEIPSDPRLITKELIEQLAVGVRRHWSLGDGPLDHVIWLAENQGVIVSHAETGSDALDSFSEWAQVGSPYIFLGSGKNSAVRTRLNVGHELGHLILHRNIDPRHLERPADHKLMEDQAFRFAGAFLLPERSFSRDLYAPTLAAFKALKPRWKVSIGAMISRARELGFLSDDQARRQWINLTRQGWRTREPLDDSLGVEQPHVLQRAFEMVRDSGINVRAEILGHGICAPEDAEALLGLPPGALTEADVEEHPPAVRSLHPRNDPVTDRKEQAPRGHVVAFRPRAHQGRH